MQFTSQLFPSTVEMMKMDYKSAPFWCAGRLQLEAVPKSSKWLADVVNIFFSFFFFDHKFGNIFFWNPKKQNGRGKQVCGKGVVAGNGRSAMLIEQHPFSPWICVVALQCYLHFDSYSSLNAICLKFSLWIFLVWKVKTCLIWFGRW